MSKITIVDRDSLLDDQLRELAERRLLFALSRFSSKIDQIDLVVSDENGPRGGIDKACQVSVGLHRSGNVVVSDKDDSMARCLSRVAEKAGRAVARVIDRSQQVDRSRPTIGL